MAREQPEVRPSAPAITNRHRLPKEIYNAITKNRYFDPNEEPFDFSATEIINPVQLATLKKRYPDKLRVFDAVDMFWSFLGAIGHNVLQEAWEQEEGTKAEERLYTTVFGKTLGGKPDYYGNNQIRDYKTTKVYKVIKGDYTEWEQQLNILAYLAQKNGLQVNSVRIIAILFDWKKHETYKQGYPEVPVLEIPLRLWSLEEQETFITERIDALLKAEECTDAELMLRFPCSKRDMWQDIKCWQVKKQGHGRAAKNCDTEAEAKAFAAQKGSGYYCFPKLTNRTRCIDWCACSTICMQHKMLAAAEGNAPDEDDREVDF